jgi:hypothetical protein
MNSDGSDQKVVRSDSKVFHPAWSPDGSKLAVTDFGSIYLINIDGTNPTRITQVSGGSGYDSDPAWSPDGTELAFTRRLNCGFDDCESGQIWVVKADGSNPTMLKDSDYSSPAWSPDGTKIIFNNYEGLFVMKRDGSGFENVANTSGGREFDPSWQAVQSSPPQVNPIDDPQFFVRQHYLDFLNREPDAAGLQFWKGILDGRLNSCGTADNTEANTCRAQAKASVSEAFFVSVEFQQTGYLVYRLYKSSFDSAARPRGLPRYSEFLRDAQAIGSGVIVNAAGWEQKLETNKVAFLREFVQRAEFTARYPASLSGEQYVLALLTNAGLPSSGAEREAALAAYGSGGVEGRANALRSVAESSLLFRKEFNPAFVLMQYFGYLRRNADEGEDASRPFAGYDFWLTKLNNESGDTTRFQTIDQLLEPTKRARMVEAFVITGEYRRRFGPE